MKDTTTIYPRTNHILINILLELLIISIPIIIAYIANHDRNLVAFAILTFIGSLLFTQFTIYSIPWITSNENEIIIHRLIPFKNRHIKWSSIIKIVPMKSCFSIITIHSLATFIYTDKRTCYAFPMDAINIEKLHQHWAKLNHPKETSTILYDKIPTGIIEFQKSTSTTIWSCINGLLGIFILVLTLLLQPLLFFLSIPNLLIAYQSFETYRRTYEFTPTHLIIRKGNGNAGLSIPWNDIINVEFCGHRKIGYSVRVLTKSYRVHFITINNRLSDETLKQLQQAGVPLIDKLEKKIKQ